jgi:succinate dehydrogenase / fumarate reductase flavoprotein subunit
VSDLDTLGQVIETDVLVIGGGLAGLWAANRARESVNDVLIVEKGPPLGWAGQGYFSGGGMEACPPTNDPEDHVKDVIYLGDGLYEQDVLENVFKQSWDRIQDLQRLGVEFLKDDSGDLWHVPQRGLDYLWCYLGKPYGSGGEDMMRALAKESQRLGVRYQHRTYITDLLKNDDGTVIGAVGFDTRSGDYFVFKAGAVIIATGNCSMKGHYEDILMSCGDGTEMAYRAGAELKNMEFATIWVVPQHFRWEGITYMLPLGARFVDGNGEPFADPYSPILKSNIDYNYLCRFMAMEARKGKGPFYVDCSQMSDENKERMIPQSGWTALQYQKLLDKGIRPFEEKQEWCPGINWLGGGVQTDLNMQTQVPGLFVAGKTRSIDPGIYFGGWSLCWCAATGRWAGEYAARHAQENKNREPNLANVKTLKKDLFASLQNGGHDPYDTLREVQETVFPYDVLILKNEASLTEALGKVKNIMANRVPQMGAKNVRDLMRLRETKAMARFAELFLEASLLRKETRASHYREDYPTRNNEQFLKWFHVAQKEDGSSKFREVPVPVEKYKIPIDRYYTDNFKF